MIALLSAERFLLPERWADRRLEDASAHVEGGAHDEARAEFQTVLRRQPRHLHARRQLARMEWSLGRFEHAYLEYQTLVELHPDDVQGLLDMATLLRMGGRLEAAEAAAGSAVDAQPSHAGARVFRADVRTRLGRYHGAQVDAEAALRQDRTDAAAWVLLSETTAAMEGTDAGVEAVERGLAAAGRAPALLLQKARLLARDDRAAAREHTDAVLADEPGNPDALALRVLLAAADGRVDEARTQLDEALARAPGSEGLATLRTRLSEADGPEDHERLLAEFVELDAEPAQPPGPPAPTPPTTEERFGEGADRPREQWPGQLAALRREVDAYVEQRDWDGAATVVDTARQTYPDTMFGPWLEGNVASARGDLDEAEGLLREALAAAPRSVLVLTTLASVWAEQDGPAAAGERLMDLAEQDPAFGYARRLAARSYLASRQPARAEAALRRGFELQPASPVPHRELAAFYLELDRVTEAIDLCRQGLERFPQDVVLEQTLARASTLAGEDEEAIERYEAVLAARPDLDGVAADLARLLVSEDGEAATRRAVEIVQRLEADRPSDPAVLDAMGWVHFQTGDPDRARGLLEAAAKGLPDEPSVNYHLAAVYAREGETGLARERLQVALGSSTPFAERPDAQRLSAEIASPGAVPAEGS